MNFERLGESAEKTDREVQVPEVSEYPPYNPNWAKAEIIGHKTAMETTAEAGPAEAPREKVLQPLMEQEREIPLAQEKIIQLPIAHEGTGREHEKMENERAVFEGDAIFTDIDETLTDNSGRLDQENVDRILEFMDGGGTFVPVTGRARFESVRGIVERLDVPFIIINNGAEIFDRNGERLYESLIPDEQVEAAFDIAAEHGLIWMQNKRDQEGNEYLFSNFTEETERAMEEVGINDTVRNEEMRIGLEAKQATAEEVMAIPEQNYKIQMMSPDYKAVRAAYEELQSRDIPCMLNMQSKITGEFHWVEVIQGTKHDAIQKLIDMELPEIEEIVTVGNGGNDISMLQSKYHDGKGRPIENTGIAVRNSSESVLGSVRGNVVLDDYNAPAEDKSEESFGVAVARIVDYIENKHKLDEAAAKDKSIRANIEKLGMVYVENEQGLRKIINETTRKPEKREAEEKPEVAEWLERYLGSRGDKKRQKAS